MDEIADWTAAVAKALDTHADVDTDAILDAARDAARAASRPAAPVTTYLLGMAVAQGKGTAPELAARVTALAQDWPAASQ